MLKQFINERVWVAGLSRLATCEPHAAMARYAPRFGLLAAPIRPLAAYILVHTLHLTCLYKSVEIFELVYDRAAECRLETE